MKGKNTFIFQQPYLLHFGIKKTIDDSENTGMNIFLARKEHIMAELELFKVAEIELIYKNPIRAKDRPKIITSIDAYEVLMNQWDENKIGFIEQAKLLLLNRANQVLGLSELSSGGVTGTVVDPRLVFAAALKANACSIILAHNHPSGNLKPSRPDECLTEKLREGGKYLDITLLDHLIVSLDGYYSFGEDMSYSAEYIQENYKDRPLSFLRPF